MRHFDNGHQQLKLIDMLSQIDKISTADLLEIYSQILTELKTRNIIRTKNLLGDLGEYLAIDHYNNTPGLPKLTMAPSGTKSIDAISGDGKRYAIKSTTSNLTGVFYGLNSPDSSETNEQIFDYAIVVKFGHNFKLEKIIELSWSQFLANKKWHSRMSAWNLSVSNKLITDSNLIFDNGTGSRGRGFNPNSIADIEL